MSGNRHEVYIGAQFTARMVERHVELSLKYAADCTIIGRIKSKVNDINYKKNPANYIQRNEGLFVMYNLFTNFDINGM